MDIALHLPLIFAPKDVTAPSARVWEHKTFNRQAVIWESNARDIDMQSYMADLRRDVKHTCLPNLLRGLALGTVLNVARLPDGITELAQAIDARQKSSTVWQWAIVVSEHPRVVVAIHTWMRVSLTNIYESALAEYRQEGYEVGAFKKDKDALLKFLTRIKAVDMPEI